MLRPFQPVWVSAAIQKVPTMNVSQVLARVPGRRHNSNHVPELGRKRPRVPHQPVVRLSKPRQEFRVARLVYYIYINSLYSSTAVAAASIPFHTYRHNLWMCQFSNHEVTRRARGAASVQCTNGMPVGTKEHRSRDSDSGREGGGGRRRRRRGCCEGEKLDDAPSTVSCSKHARLLQMLRQTQIEPLRRPCLLSAPAILARRWTVQHVVWKRESSPSGESVEKKRKRKKTQSNFGMQ